MNRKIISLAIMALLALVSATAANAAVSAEGCVNQLNYDRQLCSIRHEQDYTNCDIDYEICREECFFWGCIPSMARWNCKLWRMECKRQADRNLRWCIGAAGVRFLRCMRENGLEPELTPQLPQTPDAGASTTGRDDLAD